VERWVKEAEEASLFEKRGGTSWARARVALEPFGRGRVKLAVEEGGRQLSPRTSRARAVRAFRHNLHARDAARDQKLSHGLARAEDSVLDRAQGEARHLRYLVVAQVVRVSQHYKLSVGGRELADDLLYLRAPLAALGLLLGRERLARDGLLEGRAALA